MLRCLEQQRDSSLGSGGACSVRERHCRGEGGAVAAQSGYSCSCTEQDIATAAQSYKDIAGERERVSQDIAVQCTINTEL